MTQPSLFDHLDEAPQPESRPPDQPARDFAVDPRNDVVLEASAGTGKTRVLVDRYVRLLALGVDPRNILAMTFTRKAATEMRDRVLATLRREATAGLFPPDVWKSVGARLHDVQITTIDGFCFGLLREFPLEAGVDPTFEVADETEMARFSSEALDVALERARDLVVSDEAVRLLLVRVKAPVLRGAIGALIDRRQVALPAIRRFVGRQAEPASAADASRRFLERLRAALPAEARATLVDDGPRGAADFHWTATDLAGLDDMHPDDMVGIQHLRRRFEAHFLTRDGKPRQQIERRFKVELFSSKFARERYGRVLKTVAPAVLEAIDALDRDLDRVLARGVLRVLELAVDIYETLLAEHALLDFTAMLDRAVTLLERQEEFARSRLKLQSRYHHLLVDEFQDTSRQQWRLVELLVDAWTEGEGVADVPTSIFIVGDRKQSIYRFRHAEVTLLDAAARRIGLLRPDRPVRQAISTSFRSVPELLAFVNALSAGMAGDETIEDRWQYRDTDRFPTPEVADGALRDGQPVVGLVAEPAIETSAAAVADEVVRLLETATVRDRERGARPIRPDDIAILFRARAGHQYFEDALERRGVRTYVYKGLGFFDAPEVQDLQALLRFLARPDSDLRAAEFLRSRFVRLSDAALVALAPRLSRALLAADPPDVTLNETDAALLTRARAGVHRWLDLARHVPPGDVIDAVLRESAYVFELRGRRLEQARENLKKVRALVRRVENRGYVTIDRLASYFETLRAGDDSNAIVQAADAVNLMTIHAAKGLEFPIVFVVNLQASGRGRTGGFSVIEQGPDGEPDVTFGATEATALDDRRELEELRRLLYVAVTRARDRLYLATEVDDQGRFKRGARSLASLLPASLALCFSEAKLEAADRVSWHSAAGRFEFLVCRPAPEPRYLPESPAAQVAVQAAGASPIEPVRSPEPLAQPASSRWMSKRLPGARRPSVRQPQPDDEGVVDDRLAGILVHRLLQRRVDPADGERAKREALALLTTADRVDLVDEEATVARALALFRSVWQDAELAELFGTGECHFEVPFSWVDPDAPDVVVRGSVDCLVKRSDGALELLEFKTGSPRPEHDAQLELYLRAMRDAFPGVEVRGRVCYPSADPGDDRSSNRKSRRNPARQAGGLG
jgi:ATP-dependent helicase/nuclease subunit A